MSWVTSQLRRMINMTLVTHADGAPLDALSRHWGFPRPHFIGAAPWRAFLKVVCYGKRATGTVFFDAVDAALGEYALSLTVQMDPDEPARLYSPSNAFRQDHVGRYIRIPGYGIFRSVGPVSVADVSGSYVDLCPIATRNWQAADWSSLADVTTVEDALILPFEIHEPTPGPGNSTTSTDAGITPGDPAVVRVYVFGGPDSVVPPTYIQSGDAKIFTVDGDTLVFSSEHGFVDDDPVEVAGSYGDAETVIQTGFSSALPVSVIQVEDTSDFPSSGTLQITSSVGIQQNVTYTGKTPTSFTGCSGGEGVVSGLEVVDGQTIPADTVVSIGTLPTGLAIDTRYYVIVVSPTEVKLSPVAGGSPLWITGVGSGTLVIMRARPDSEPFGGHIQEDVAEDGDQVVGPYPLYLIGPLIMSDLVILLERLVPAGVGVKMMRPPN